MENDSAVQLRKASVLWYAINTPHQTSVSAGCISEAHRGFTADTPRLHYGHWALELEDPETPLNQKRTRGTRSGRQCLRYRYWALELEDHNSTTCTGALELEDHNSTTCTGALELEDHNSTTCTGALELEDCASTKGTSTEAARTCTTKVYNGNWALKLKTGPPTRALGIET
ncbi:hypothetical protein BaRGS_00005205 [Batillaria attramentaria]|uniref:Uncharacterized protein n=1 Tax=Batillaria attramentaria TaxID=370345 RepID=A0ABD0LVZ5_9CAEN